MTECEKEAGQYLYYLNGELAAVEEHWQTERQQDKPTVIRAQRKVPGLELSVIATLERWEVTGFEVSWEAHGNEIIQATYNQKGPALLFSRTKGEMVTHAPSDLLADYPPLVQYPLMRIFTGPVIRRLAEAGGESAVLVPAIAAPDKPDTLLLPDVSQRCVIQEDEAVLEKTSGDEVACELWRFMGGQYGPEARFWLDRSGRLQRYCWQQDEARQWDVRLA